MARTYAPHLVVMLQRIQVYVAKHQTLLNATLSPAQWTQLQNILTAITAMTLPSERETP